jgi:hypothetical protein
LTRYLDGGWESYAHVLALLREEGDLVLDGRKGPAALADEAYVAIVAGGQLGRRD